MMLSTSNFATAAALRIATIAPETERNNPAWWLVQTEETTPSDKDVAPKSRFKGLDEMTDDEINEFARRFYLAIQSMREAKQQQQQSS